MLDNAQDVLRAARESRIPSANDGFTTGMDRQPILIARNRQGERNARIDSRSHRGAMPCRHKRAAPPALG